MVILIVVLLTWSGICASHEAVSSNPAPTQSLGFPPDLIQVDIFTGSEGGYHCFRAPALLYTTNGSLLAFAEGRGQHTGSCSESSDVVIVMKKSGDGGMTWSTLSLVHSEYPKSIGNPAPIEDVTAGKIFLLFSRNTRQVLVLESEDEGETWSNMVDITDMVALPSWFKVAPSNPGGLQLPSGRLIVGAYAPRENGPGAFAIYSDDHSKTWTRSKPMGDTSTERCQIAPLGLGEHSVKQLIMTAQTPLGHYVAYSNDSGESWSELSAPKSLNPQADCESSILSITYKGVYLDTHLYTTQPHAAERQNLTFFHSVDGGREWKADYLLWKGPAAYSSLAYDAQHIKVLCLFECGVISYSEKLSLAIFSPLI